MSTRLSYQISLPDAVFPEPVVKTPVQSPIIPDVAAAESDFDIVLTALEERKGMAEVKPSDGWRQREREQLQAWLKLSYRQRLDWLWQAKLFAERARLSAAVRHANKKSDP